MNRRLIVESRQSPQSIRFRPFGRGQKKFEGGTPAAAAAARDPAAPPLRRARALVARIDPTLPERTFLLWVTTCPTSVRALPRDSAVARATARRLRVPIGPRPPRSHDHSARKAASPSPRRACPVGRGGGRVRTRDARDVVGAPSANVPTARARLARIASSPSPRSPAPRRGADFLGGRRQTAESSDRGPLFASRLVRSPRPAPRLTLPVSPDVPSQDLTSISLTTTERPRKRANRLTLCSLGTSTFARSSATGASP